MRAPASPVLILAAVVASAVIAAAPVFGDPAEDLLSVGKKAFAGGQYQLAADSFQRVRDDYPESAGAPEAAYLFGVSLFYQERWAPCLSALSLLGVRYPKSSLLPRASYWTGAANVKLGNWQSALDALTAFLSDPAASGSPALRSSAVRYRAVALEGLGRDAEAAAVYRQLLDAAPTGPDAAELTYRLAGTELRAGRYASARDLYGRILLAPSSAPGGSTFVRDSVFFTAECEMALQSFGEAERRYRTILSVYPDSPWVEGSTLRLAEIAWRQGRPAALQQVEDFLARFPDGDWRGRAYRLHADILSDRKRLAEAAADYQRAASALPDGAERQSAWYALGRAEVALGRPADAVEPFRTAAAGPAARLAEDASYRWARLLADLGRAAEAVDALQSFLKRFPESPRAEEAGRLLGTLQDKQGNGAAARASWDWLARSYPRSASLPEYLYRRGSAWLSSGGWASALDDFQQVARDYPGTAWSARSQYSIGYVYARRGEYPRALPFFQALSRDPAAGPEGPRGALAAAICLFDMGRFDQAVGAFRALRPPLPSGASAGTVALYIGRSLYRMGRLAEAGPALSDAAAALAAEGSLLGADALYWRGWSFLRLQKPAEAFSSFLAVAESYPTDPRRQEALFRAGVSKALQADDITAVLLFDQVISAAAPASAGTPSPADPTILEQAMYEKSLSLSRLGRGDDSMDALDALARAFPGSRLAAQAFYSRAEKAFSAQEYAAARSGFDRVAAGFPSSPLAGPAAYWSAESALRGGDAAGALAGFWSCLLPFGTSPAPSASGALLSACIDGFAAALEQSADASAARQYAARVRAAPGVSPEISAGVLLAVARVLLPVSADESEQVVQEVAGAAPPEPYAGEASLLLGTLAVSRQDWGRALEILGSLETSRADDVGAQAALEKGRALEASGHTAEAVDQYLKVGYLFPDLADRAAEGMFNAARLALARGEAERAARIEQALRTSFPSSPWLQKLPAVVSPPAAGSAGSP
ncbi:MAG TPA: tetratricopeptide repeat protein [Spirochaetia bacterium]|nr:tetratricopeptide repeat protein [Spirochaetia bacterium]